jgi:proteasome accessory factor B
MPTPESRYERLDTIERLLVRQPEGWTTGELARALGVDPSTIYRDLLLLESRGTGLIQHGRRYVLDHRRSLHTIKLSNHEILALYLATRLLSRHSDEHNPHVVKALEKLSDALRDRAPLFARHIDMAAAAVRSRRSRQNYVEALETLTQGWAEGRRVTLRYRAADNQISERTFEVYFIEPSSIGYACYVIGYDTLRGSLRTLKAERILEAQLTDERYQIPADCNPVRLLANAWGVVWHDESDVIVRLRFLPTVAWRVKESVWHHSQQIEDLPDGSCLFTVHLGSTLEIRPWIRQWGADVLVLAPTELRNSITLELRQALHQYEENQ